MIKYFAKAFKITNDNIILTTPLVLFLFLLSLYMGIAKNSPEKLPFAILLLITILFMLSAFFAGWLFMVKKAVDLDKQDFAADEDKAKASFGLIKELPTGIGEYFFSFIGALILYVALAVLVSFVSYKIGMHFIGKVDISLEELKLALSSPLAMKSLVTSLSSEQLMKLNKWNFLFLFSVASFSFVTMFWYPQIVVKNKNPFVAFFQSLTFTFKNFLSSMILYIYISAVNFIVSLANTFSVINPILYFASLIAYFYFVVYVVVLVFLYYDNENNRENKVGDSVENPDSIRYIDAEGEPNPDNSGGGANSVGEKQPGDTDSKSD